VIVKILDLEPKQLSYVKEIEPEGVACCVFTRCTSQ